MTCRIVFTSSPNKVYHDTIAVDKTLSGKSGDTSAPSHEPHPVPIILHELKPHEHDPVALPPPVGVEYRAFNRVLLYIHASRHDPFEHEHCPLHVILGRYEKHRIEPLFQK